MKIKVWDLPLRLFHWLLVLGVGGAWYTVENDMIDQHVTIGIGLLGLTIFRLIWGFVGAETARFSTFLKGPRAIMAYLKTLSVGKDAAAPAPAMGHNAGGGWISLLIILSVLAQASMGLFSNDDIFTEGPLYHLVTKDQSDSISWLHIRFFNVILGLAVFHILAILYYQLRKGLNLTGPMITGNSTIHQGHDIQWSPRDFFIAVVATIAIVWGVLSL